MKAKLNSIIERIISQVSNPWSLWIIFLIAFFIRILYVTANEVNLDEPFTIFYAQQSIPELMQLFTKENNPPLHFVITHFMIKYFGMSAFALRLPSVLFSSVTVLLIFLFSRRFLGKDVALVAAFLALFSNAQIEYAHVIRAYALKSMLTAASVYLFFSLMHEGKTKYIVLLGITNVLLGYTHFFGLFVPLVQGLFALMRINKDRKFFYHTLLAMGFSFLLYAPYIGILLTRYSVATGVPIELHQLYLSSIFNRMTSLFNINLAGVGVTVTILLSVLYIIKVRSFRILPKEVYYLMLAFFIPYFTLWLGSSLFNLFLKHYLLFASVPLYAFVACLSCWLIRKHVVFSLILVTIVISTLVFFSPYKKTANWNVQVVDTLRSIKQPADQVIIVPQWSLLEFGYHYNRSYFANYRHFDALMATENFKGMITLDEHIEAPANGRLIYIDYGLDYGFGSNANLDILNGRFKLMETFDLQGHRIFLFEKKMSAVKLRMKDNKDCPAEF
jgi:4-amino-4-deoxy-L-arabinose transferase-like glycosyltransferase